MAQRICPNGHVTKEAKPQFCPTCGAPLPAAKKGSAIGCYPLSLASKKQPATVPRTAAGSFVLRP